MIVLLALVLYAAAGIAIAAAFLGVRRHARAAGACSGDAGRADCALSRRRRALALRAHRWLRSSR